LTHFEAQLRAFVPPIPPILQEPISAIFVAKEPLPVLSGIDSLCPHLITHPLVDLIRGAGESRPLRVGVLFSGGQAPGGHNVVAGLFDTLQKIHEESKLFGFIGGPKGLIEGKERPLAEEDLQPYRNMGGFDLLGSGRDKIETKEQFQAAAKSVKEKKLDGLVIIGGDDSNTNAAFLADYFLAESIPCAVVGIPKTIDGDLSNEFVPIPFGFDTAAKTFAATVGSIERDALSARKYTFFIRLMGRSASHITLETAMQTHPNLTFISEEVKKEERTLKSLIEEIVEMIIQRESRGLTHGVILLPEGLIEFIPEMALLLRELQKKTISHQSKALLEFLPRSFVEQLEADRDPHGNLQVSKIETERLFISLVKEELKRRNYSKHFSPQPLFLGYEGRSTYPSYFDATYCSALGAVSAILIRDRKTGMMAALGDLHKRSDEWVPRGVPLISQMIFEERKGQKKGVIKKTLVDLEGSLFKEFAHERGKWLLEDHYRYPSPIQYLSNRDVIESPVLTLQYQRLAKVSI